MPGDDGSRRRPAARARATRQQDVGSGLSGKGATARFWRRHVRFRTVTRSAVGYTSRGLYSCPVIATRNAGTHTNITPEAEVAHGRGVVPTQDMRAAHPVPLHGTVKCKKVGIDWVAGYVCTCLKARAVDPSAYVGRHHKARRASVERSPREGYTALTRPTRGVFSRCCVGIVRWAWLPLRIQPNFEHFIPQTLDARSGTAPPMGCEAGGCSTPGPARRGAAARRRRDLLRRPWRPPRATAGRRRRPPGWRPPGRAGHTEVA